MICSACDRPIRAEDFDNRYWGCTRCGWRLHHSCGVELLTVGKMPCAHEGSQIAGMSVEP